ncbi:MAG TPA: flagellin [Bryobacteraceae bacterium]|jgi:flagellin|nr:flagellin [Bryobacteraceae bacterium]
MSLSIQTNVNSMIAQENLRVNSDFQSRTIQRLTSGYRINSSGDDAAGLSIANQFRSDVSELQQGVRNANDGVSQLQIIDGGLANISQMLDRMKTLATQSASSTFTGDRNTLDAEYQQLISEITRQAADIGLNAGGNFQKTLSVYIGGARTSTLSGSATVSIDLSGNSVDAAGLGLAGTTVTGGSAGVDFNLGAGGKRLDDPAAVFAAGGSQAFTFNYTDASGNVLSKVVTIQGGASGLTGDQVISALNSSLAGTGITAQIDTTNGKLQISGTRAFTVYAGTVSAGNGVAANGGSIVNTGQYNLQATGAAAFASTGSETFTVSDGTHQADVTLNAANSGTLSDMVNSINSQLSAAGVKVTALLANNGADVSFQASGNFTVVESAYDNTGGGKLFGAVGSKAVTAAVSSASSGSAAQAAIDAINKAVKTLGTVQGVIGAGQNKLNYSIALAQSQIANFSAAESRIRDADVAAEAANLTKAQVLQQASLAAMAQANSAPQAVLALLRG